MQKEEAIRFIQAFPSHHHRYLQNVFYAARDFLFDSSREKFFVLHKFVKETDDLRGKLSALCTEHPEVIVQAINSTWDDLKRNVSPMCDAPTLQTGEGVFRAGNESVWSGTGNE